MTRSPRRAASHPTSRRPILALAVCGLLVAAFDPIRSAEQKFYADDPLTTAPETGDASGAQEYDIGLFYDLSYNMFVTSGREHSDVRAQNVNTIDEVPDSSWFTNRIGARPLTVDEITRGPVIGPSPQPGTWTISREKSAGAAPGFTATDPGGHSWFLSFDAPTNPEGATGAVVVSTKLFWALGYNQVEYFVADLHRDSVVIAPGATKRRPNGKRTPLTQDDIDEVLERADRRPDGSYRAAAGRMLPGRVLGGFKYFGTRPDDPNDLVPHEHRRELRALRVFGAWTNLVDMKAGNTLDTVITEGPRGVVKHYLQDVGSTFGVGANAPHGWEEGFEYVFQGGTTTRKLFTLGLARSPYQKADYEDVPAAGRFEGDTFDPETWKPRVPTAAYLEMRADDAFWAAQRVMAFTDELIRAAVKTGQYSDPKAEQHIADVLIKRRDKIGRAYLPKINPIVDPVFDGTTLTFGNAAVQYRVAEAPTSYTAVWSRFDNATGTASRFGDTTSREPKVAAPNGLPTAPDSFVKVALGAQSASHPSWAQPIDVYFRRVGTGWKLVGLERMPAVASPGQPKGN